LVNLLKTLWKGLTKPFHYGKLSPETNPTNKGNSMTENIETQAPFNFEQANYSDLLTEAKRLNGLVADLNGEVTSLQNKAMYTERAFANRERQHQDAKSILTTLIEENEIDNEEAVKELVQIFGIEIMREVEFTVTLEISGTVEIPMGTELDEYSFNVDSFSYDGQDVNFSQDNLEISDWNFTE
jgi:hypothetical protein